MTRLSATLGKRTPSLDNAANAAATRCGNPGSIRRNWRRAKIFAGVLLLCCLTRLLPAASPNAPETTFAVQRFGAVPDGTTLNTGAIQKAIDACSAAGGGTVYFSPGVYLSGTVFLKDNVRFYLDVGAVLRGSSRLEDYATLDRKSVLGSPAFAVGFLIGADGVRNASIEGRGTIDGQGGDFWSKTEMLRANPPVRKPMPQRPRALICIVKGTSLLFRGVTLTNSPCYTLWLLGCDDVKIEAVTIRNPHDGPNTDGLDIDCCSRVCVSQCVIEGGDDAIAIKSDAGRLGEDKPCEDISVTNCVLCSVPACAVRIGYEGDSVIRNCTFSNLTIYNTDIGIDVISIRPTAAADFPIVKGTRCENILFENITMRDVNRAIYLWMEAQPESKVFLKNVRIANVLAESRFGSYVGCVGSAMDRSVEDIALDNVRLILTAKMPADAPQTGAGVWGSPMQPYGLYCARVAGLSLRDLDIDFRRAGGVWQNAVCCEDSRGVRVDSLHTQGFAPLAGDAVIALKNADAVVRNCDAEPSVPAFLHAQNNSHATVAGCDLTPAQTPAKTDDQSTVR